MIIGAFCFGHWQEHSMADLFGTSPSPAPLLPEEQHQPEPDSVQQAPEEPDAAMQQPHQKEARLSQLGQIESCHWFRYNCTCQKF